MSPALPGPCQVIRASTGQRSQTGARGGGRLVDRLAQKEGTFLWSGPLWPRPELGAGERAASHRTWLRLPDERAPPEGLAWSECAGPHERLNPPPPQSRARPLPRAFASERDSSHTLPAGEGRGGACGESGRRPGAKDLGTASQPS